MNPIARPTYVLPLLLIAGLLAACGDDGKDSAPKSGTSTPPVQPSTGPDSGTEPGVEPEQIELPEVAAISEKTARGVLRSSLLALPPNGPTEAYENAVRVLGYLADLGDETLEEPVRSKLLAQDEGEYDDLEYAAIGWAALHRAGNAEAAPAIEE